MYKDTVTVFNRVRGIDGDTWYPTILHGVNVNLDKASIAKQYGESSQDLMVLNVPLSNGEPGAGITGNDAVWIPPKEWQQLRDKTGNVTFSYGTGFDFVWVGEWDGGSVVYDDNYGDLTFYDYMLLNEDFVYAVTSVSLLSVIPHLEVTGR